MITRCTGLHPRPTQAGPSIADWPCFIALLLAEREPRLLGGDRFRRSEVRGDCRAGSGERRRGGGRIRLCRLRRNRFHPRFGASHTTGQGFEIVFGRGMGGTGTGRMARPSWRRLREGSRCHEREDGKPRGKAHRVGPDSKAEGKSAQAATVARQLSYRQTLRRRLRKFVSDFRDSADFLKSSNVAAVPEAIATLCQASWMIWATRLAERVAASIPQGRLSA